eukprot:278295-Chlamydomonas_euryale.AAC.1
MHVDICCHAVRFLSSKDSVPRPRAVLWPMHGLKQCVTKHPNAPQSCRHWLQGSYDQHTTWRGFAKTFFWGGREGFRQVTPGFCQLRHVVTPYASYATPLDELRPQPWRVPLRST